MSQQQPTPVTDDADATAQQLLDRAAVDYTAGQQQRARRANEDRIHGNEPAGLNR
ncbi:hypothetical protein [Streptomyces sp. NPDC008240]|uniref:hypothetical protein n=1 Tax=Streptomyces sp. NPDC008240 TaxID=3364822 RepID=UPI0036E19A1C